MSKKKDRRSGIRRENDIMNNDRLKESINKLIDIVDKNIDIVDKNTEKVEKNNDLMHKNNERLVEVITISKYNKESIARLEGWKENHIEGTHADHDKKHSKNLKWFVGTIITIFLGGGGILAAIFESESIKKIIIDVITYL